MKQEIDIGLIENKDWEKPTLVSLNISLTKNEDCTGKIGPGSPDGNLTCTYAGIATS